MSQEIKFDNDELKTLKDIQKKYFDVQNSFGQTTIARINIDQQLEDLDKFEKELEDKLLQTRQDEKDFVDSITKKYGDGRLNIESGTFIPNEKNK
tara:strand:+ start:234 stop:518 length:285 start_codon:yes stop_codon:yes gene_type:complete